MDEKIKTKTSQGVSAGSHPFMKTSQILIYLFWSPYYVAWVASPAFFLIF